MGKTTARSLLLIRKFLDELMEGDGFKKVYERLAPEERWRFDVLKPDDWVDYALYFRLLELGAVAAGADLMKFCENFGIYQAEHDTKLLHRTAMRLGGPGIMIMEADQIWKRYHDTGHMRISGVLPNAAVARVEGLEGGGPLLCAVLQGFIRKALLLCGVKELRMEHNKCRFRGDDVCEYTGNWKR